MSNIEISNNCKMLDIKEIANKLGIDDINYYGKYKCKIHPIKKDNDSCLVLVTATTPTKSGEGKTTVSIGLVDALNKLNEKSIGVLREPSLGPVFGMKGGATGGGYAQVVPMEDINLHFTGDIHAITSANNLLSSAIDNHIYQGNKLNIKEVIFKRCLDINDRNLRDKFNITAASEVMAIFTLANSLEDLKRRLGNIVIGYDMDGNMVYAKDLRIEGAMTSLLKDAFNPNLVQTLENNPVLIHGGPFANIAHGCSSIISLETALSISNFIVTEAGFASDLGCEKFMNITSRSLNKQPDIIVLVTTLKALDYHGGYSNLDAHIESLKTYSKNLIVALNKFTDDKDEEIEKLKQYVEGQNIAFEVVTSYKDGSIGSINLANKIINMNKVNNMSYTYKLENSLMERIESVAKNIYHAKEVKYTPEALEKIKQLEIYKYPICISKTQYSITDDPKKLGYPKDFVVTVNNLELKNGAEYITVYLNDVITMPGLSKNPNYEQIDVIEDKIIGLD